MRSLSPIKKKELLVMTKRFYYDYVLISFANDSIIGSTFTLDDCVLFTSAMNTVISLR